MRPQHDAAENLGKFIDKGSPGGASMRPQHDAAENFAFGFVILFTFIASMRPQHDAAENGRGMRRHMRRSARFNEAAA